MPETTPFTATSVSPPGRADDPETVYRLTPH